MNLDKQIQTTILIKGALKGSQKAFSDLMDIYWDDIIKSLEIKKAPSHIQEDIALISFTKAFENLDSYNNEFTFQTWLSKIASNTLIDFYRKQKKTLISLDEVFVDDFGNEFKMDFSATTLTPEEEFISLQEENKIENMINDLPNIYSQILNLRYLSSCSYTEISDKLNLPISNVKIRIMRGRKLLIETINNKH